MSAPAALAFVDVETTGLSPSCDRIAEIGVVTVDGDRVERWSTLLRTPDRRRPLDSVVDAPTAVPHAEFPAFAAIAADLARRLHGRLFVAHNARFDYAFVRAELDRAGIPFAAPVLCSVMLSRALSPQLAHHDLDALAHAHALTVEERHRALPDAELLWQWWRTIHRDHPRRTIRRAIAKLMAGPALPPALDPTVIDRLPARPGAYVLRDIDGTPIRVGAAANLRLQLVHVFRVDRATPRALEQARRVADVSWQPTGGILGARLAAARLDATHFARATRRLAAPHFTWRFVPDASPCVALVPLTAVVDGDATYGLFATERKARNALARLADSHALCRSLLGLAVDDSRGDAVGMRRARLRIFEALRTLRVPGWPHPGPIGIRERADLHVVDRWRFVGTARSDDDLHALLGQRPHDFDPRIFRLLCRALRRLPPRRVVDLSSRVG